MSTSEFLEYPRVLIISPNILNQVHGAGAALSGLFAGWPRERLAEIHSQGGVPPNWDVCENYYQLYRRISKRPGEWVRRTLDYLRGVNESLDGITSIRMTRCLRQWLEGFDPQLVFSQMGTLWLSRLTNKVVETFNVPLAVHISDDYISDWPVSGYARRNVFPLAQVLNLWNRRELLRSLHTASLRFCISRFMSLEYQKRYGYSFVPLYNGINPDQWPTRKTRAVRAEEPFRILYSGTVKENGYLSSLREVADAVVSLAASGMHIRMEIATHTDGFAFRDVLEHPPYVRFVDMVPLADLPRRLAEFDLLLITLDFDASGHRLRYSMPGKVSEYAISGTPILLYAPPDTALVEYASREGWGYIVSTQGRKNIEVALSRLASDVGLRRRLASTARQVALRDLDIRRIRSDFHAALCQAAFL